MEYSFEIISEFVQQSFYNLKAFSIFSSGGHLVQDNKRFQQILVKGHSINIPMELFQNSSTSYAAEVI